MVRLDNGCTWRGASLPTDVARPDEIAESVGLYRQGLRKRS